MPRLTGPSNPPHSATTAILTEHQPLRPLPLLKCPKFLLPQGLCTFCSLCLITLSQTAHRAGVSPLILQAPSSKATPPAEAVCSPETGTGSVLPGRANQVPRAQKQKQQRASLLASCLPPRASAALNSASLGLCLPNPVPALYFTHHRVPKTEHGAWETPRAPPIVVDLRSNTALWGACGGKVVKRTGVGPGLTSASVCPAASPRVSNETGTRGFSGCGLEMSCVRCTGEERT